MRSLVDHLFRPDRVMIPEATRSACATLDPAEAWRRLHEMGHLPPGWLADPRRRFAWLPGLARDERAQRLRKAPFVPSSPHPEGGSEALRIASMAVAMERAEAHARAFVHAAALWGAARPETILWVPSDRSSYDYQIHDTKPGVWEPDGLVWKVFPHAVAESRWKGIADALAAEARDEQDARAIRSLAPWVLGRDEWLDAVRRGDRVPAPASAVVGGGAYAELPSPFDAALEVFACGFGILPSSADVLVLGAP
jgi:hypothetical protein